MKAFGSRVNEGEGEGEGDSPFFCAAPTRGVPTVIGDWSDRAARNRPSRGRLEVAPPGKEHGARDNAPPSRRVKHAAPSGARKDAGPSRRRGRRRSGRRRSCRVSGIGSFKEKEEGGTGKSPLLIPRETGRGIVHQRRPPRCRCRTTRRDDPCGRPPLNGATVRRPLPGHYRTGGVERHFLVADWDRRVSRADWGRRPASFRCRLGPASFRAPGMATWSGDSAGERCDPAGHPQGAPTIIGNWSDRAARNRPSSGRLEVAPPGLRHEPARNRAGIVHQRRPPRCRCRTTRRGDPCGRPPPNGATVRRPLPGHYRTGGAAT